MIQQQVYILNTFLMGADAVCIIASAYAAYYAGLYSLEDFMPFDGNVFLILVLPVMFFNNYFMGRFRLYGDTPHATLMGMVVAIVKALGVDFVLLTTAVFLMGITQVSPAFVWLFGGFALVLILVVRLLVRHYVTRVARKGFNVRTILVIGDAERGRYVTEALEKQMSWGHTVAGHLDLAEPGEDDSPTPQGIEALQERLRTQPIDEVLFALTRNSRVDLDGCLDICRKMGVPARILPGLWKPDGHALDVEVCQGMPFINLRVDNFDAYGLLCKRLMDILGGLVGVVIFLLFYPVVGLAIKLDSPGPVLFAQLRKGRHGRIFRLYKFRTMYVNAEQMKQGLLDENEMNGHMFKLADDPRVTRVGRFLRKSSIDEFPQFINVLRGEMSLVGTRPPTLDEVEKYKPDHLRRIAAKPGITGMWQISGRNKIHDFEKVVELDCRYLDHWSLWGDFRILMKTVLVVLQRKGAV